MSIPCTEEAFKKNLKSSTKIPFAGSRTANTIDTHLPAASSYQPYDDEKDFAESQPIATNGADKTGLSEVGEHKNDPTRRHHREGNLFSLMREGREGDFATSRLPGLLRTSGYAPRGEGTPCDSGIPTASGDRP